MSVLLHAQLAGIGAIAILLTALVILGGIAALLGRLSKDDGKGIAKGPDRTSVV